MDQPRDHGEALEAPDLPPVPDGRPSHDHVRPGCARQAVSPHAVALPQRAARVVEHANKLGVVPGWGEAGQSLRGHLRGQPGQLVPHCVVSCARSGQCRSAGIGRGGGQRPAPASRDARTGHGTRPAQECAQSAPRPLHARLPGQLQAVARLETQPRGATAPRSPGPRRWTQARQFGVG